MDSDNSSMSSRSSSPELDVFIGASSDLQGLSSTVSSTTSRAAVSTAYTAGAPGKPRGTHGDHHAQGRGTSSSTTNTTNTTATTNTTGGSSSASSSMMKMKSLGGSGGGSRPRLSKEDLDNLQQQQEEQLGEPCGQELRLKINSRERKRMQDLNVAMDGLREVMPYAHGPSVRKLSKIATLLLARNYILMLNSSLDEMKRLLSEIYGGHHSAFHACAPIGNHHPLHHHAALTSSLAAGVAAGLAAAPGPTGAIPAHIVAPRIPGDAKPRPRPLVSLPVRESAPAVGAPLVATSLSARLGLLARSESAEMVGKSQGPRGQLGPEDHVAQLGPEGHVGQLGSARCHLALPRSPQRGETEFLCPENIL
ncbi:uncharacterized protein LOC144733450 [Lampetra planeri]